MLFCTSQRIQREKLQLDSISVLHARQCWSLLLSMCKYKVLVIYYYKHTSVYVYFSWKYRWCQPRMFYIAFIGSLYMCVFYSFYKDECFYFMTVLFMSKFLSFVASTHLCVNLSFFALYMTEELWMKLIFLWGLVSIYYFGNSGNKI